MKPLRCAFSACVGLLILTGCGDEPTTTAPGDVQPARLQVVERPHYFYQGQPLYVYPDSSRLVISLRTGHGLDQALETTRRVAGSQPVSSRQISQRAHVLTMPSGNVSALPTLAARLGTEAITSLAVPAYTWPPDGSDILLIDRLMIRFRATATPSQLQRLADSVGLTLVAPPASDSGRFFHLFAYPDGTTDPLAVVNRLAAHPLVAWATPDKVAGRRLATPSDPYYPYQFHLDNPLTYLGKPVDINPDLAWTETRGAGITIAVLDDGVYVNHPDFSFTAPVKVWDAWGDPDAVTDPPSSNGHGTSVAGIIFADHNSQGVAGIAPDAHIAVARIFRSFLEPATDSEIATAIAWAWTNGDADVINNSWGRGAPDDGIANAIRDATVFGRGGLGTTVVFATGNYGEVVFPASLSTVVGASAITRSGALAPYVATSGLSNKDLVAPSRGEPGEEYGIVTTDLLGLRGYDYTSDYFFQFGGTSAATPQVAGAAALVYARFPNLVQAAVRARLTTYADPWGPITTYGSGKLNVSRAAGVNPLSTSVSGASVIFTKGSYTWNASPSGGNGTIASHRWRRRFDGLQWVTVGTSASLTQTVYGGDADFDLELKVVSGAQTAYDTLRVMNCIGKPGCAN